MAGCGSGVGAGGGTLGSGGGLLMGGTGGASGGSGGGLGGGTWLEKIVASWDNAALVGDGRRLSVARGVAGWRNASIRSRAAWWTVSARDGTGSGSRAGNQVRVSVMRSAAVSRDQTR